MAKQSPLQEVRERFGSKEELAKQLYGKLDQIYVDEPEDEYQRRIRTMSNAKLLRLHAHYAEVDERFGGKSGLVDELVKLRAAGKKEDSVYRAKLERMQVSQLLDLHRTASKKAN